MFKETMETVEIFQPDDSYRAFFQNPMMELTVGSDQMAISTSSRQSAVAALNKTCLTRLLQRHQEILNTASANHLPLRFMGIAPVFKEPHVFPGQNFDMALMNLLDDPAFRDNRNRLTIPASSAADIKNAHKAGINFDAMFIAHEIPSGSVQPGEPVPLELIIPPPPPQVQQRIGQLETSSVNFWHGIRSAVSGLAKLGRAVTLPVVNASLRLVDPIILGVSIDSSWTIQDQPVGFWYYVTHWYWPSTEDEK